MTLPTLTPRPSCIAPEAWRAVPGYESAYEASTHGRVRSIRRVVDPATGRRGGGRVLKPTPNPKRGGYLYVSLCSGDSGRNMSLHRVVCVTFHGPRPVGHVTRHLDGDPNHNCPSNLVYGTPAENAEDMRRHGTNAASRRTHCPQGHEYNTQNTRWTADGHRDCLGCVGERSRRKVQCPACGVTLSRGSMHRHALRFHGASWGNLTAGAVAS